MTGYASRTKVWSGFALLIFAVLLVAIPVMAEVPRKINYQAKLADSATGQPLAGSHSITFRIYDAAYGGDLLWAETASATADSAGVMSAVLGTVTPIEIDFADPCWLEVEIAGEVLLPRREIVSVPYAFHAMNADSLGGLPPTAYVVQAELDSITGEMIGDGEITDADVSGDAAIDPGKIAGTAWTGENDGDGSGLDADTIDGLSHDAFADSGHAHDERYYQQKELNTGGTINHASNPVAWTRLKGVPPGFADGTDDTGGGVGDTHSLDAADGDPVDALYVDNDGEVGIGTLDPERKLHVTGFNPRVLIEASGSNPELNFKHEGDLPSETWALYKEEITGDLRFFQDGDRVTFESGTGNVGVGKTSPAVKLDVGGKVNTDSTYQISGMTVIAVSGSTNVFFGPGATVSAPYTGGHTTAVGYDAGRNNQGSGNTFVGAKAGRMTVMGNGNTFVGFRAGLMNTDGEYNTYLGAGAGRSTISTFSNTFIGEAAGANTDVGSYNTFLGNNAGYYNEWGGANTFLGYGSGANNEDGDANTFVGSSAGHANVTGSGNVYIGYEAGFHEEGSDKFYVANGRDTSAVLIYGDFSNGRVGLGTLNPERKLHLVGVNPRILIEASSSNPEINFKNAGDSHPDAWALYKQDGSGDLRFFQNGDRVTFEGGTGNVGIGKADPSVRLDVDGKVNTDSMYQISGMTVLVVPDSSNVLVGAGAGAISAKYAASTFVGHAAGSKNQGYANTFVGARAGRQNDSGMGNTFVGTYAGGSNSGGEDNTYLGKSAGRAAQEGMANTFVGESAGANTINGSYNVFLGAESGINNAGGLRNTFLGYNSGRFTVGGENNTYLGYIAGYGNVSGSRNVCLGYEAGYYEQGSDKLFIANDRDTAAVLIYGDFSSGRVGLGTLSPERKLHLVGDNPRILIEASSSNPEINFKNTGDSGLSVWSLYKESVTGDLRFYQNGNRVTLQSNTGDVAIGTTDPLGYRLYVSGTAYATGTWQSSDRRLKTDIEGIDSALAKVSDLKGVSFKWRRDEYSDRGLPDGTHYGMIAQEVEEVLPEIVRESPDGELAVAYTEMIPILVESIKELKAENEILRRRIEALEVAGH